MSASKDSRGAEARRRGPESLLPSLSPSKKQPNPHSVNEAALVELDDDLHDLQDDEVDNVEFSSQSSHPNVPTLSPRIHVRTSSFGNGNKSPDSPKHLSSSLPSRKGLAALKQERRDSLLGRGSSLGSPRGSGGFQQSTSLREHSGLSNQILVEMDTDSDEDSPFPPPISSMDQVSHVKNANPTIRLRANAKVPVNTGGARKMLAGIRERKFAQERSMSTPTTPTYRLGPEIPSPTEKSLGFYRLERGGVVVATSAGSIQFGIPPETIKDTLLLGIEVPQYFVVPRDRFDIVAGLNMCEVEFPGYYQFFLKNKSLTLVASAEAERSIKQLMHEILQGPPDAHLYANEECVGDYEARPDHIKEMAYFVRPRNGRSITVESLFSFIRLEPIISTVSDVFMDAVHSEKDGCDFDMVVSKARINENVEIHETTREWKVYDRGLEVASVEFWLASTVPPRFPLAMVLPTRTFVPPTLGVTVLGSSHGFDPKQATSGFVLWMYGRGVMVDPPPNATDLLKRGGISPRWISAIILTHCHADHDAGTFQKILVEGRVTLITTKTIMASFLRKYSKISGFTEAFLCRLFEPRVVKTGEDVFYGGGIFRFFYAFHALPCIGFNVNVGGKSIAYSADTLFDPDMLQQLTEEGVLSEARRDSLMAFPFEKADLVIHEAGIPPIHTPVDVLKRLSPDALKRLYVIHMTEAAAEASGLRLAKAGTENTLRVFDRDAHAHSLDVLTNSELFFPYLAAGNRFGRGIVSAAQDRMGLMDFDNPNALDFSFLDFAATGQKRFYTSSTPHTNDRDRGSSMVARASSLATNGSDTASHGHVQTSGAARDSDLSLGSVKRNSAGFDGISPSRNLIAGRRTSASTNKSLPFSADMEEEDFTVPQVADLLRLSHRITRQANDIVSANEGNGDESLYLIMRGFCRVERSLDGIEYDSDDDNVQPTEGPPGTILEPGDCFGLFVVNSSKVNGLVRRSVIRALTEVELVAFGIDALWYLLNVYPALDRRLSRMHELRALEAWRTMELNSCLKRLASFQRTQLNAVLELKEFKKGDELWTKRPGPRNAYLVADGELVFPEIYDEMADRPFEAGAFLCDFHSMIQTRRLSGSSTLGSSSTHGHHGAASGVILGAHAAGSAPLAHPTMDLAASSETSHNSSAQSLTSGEAEGVAQPLPSVTLVAKTDCRLYQISSREAFLFLESNPGVLVQIYHSYAVE